MIDRHTASLFESLRAAGTDEHGQGLVEYALMLLLVALVSIATLTILGTNLSDAIGLVESAF